MTAANGTNLPACAATGPANVSAQSVITGGHFAKRLLDNVVDEHVSIHGYVGETLLSYGRDAKQLQLTSSLYYKDEAGRMDTITVGDDEPRNSGLMALRALTIGSSVIDMMGRLHADIFFQEQGRTQGLGAKRG